MRVHVVSDVHGRTDALERAADGADALICLGDLVLFMDYADHGAGIMGRLFGADAVATLITLRTARRFDEARSFSGGLWSSYADPRAVIEDAVRAQYAAMFAVLPDPTYMTYGNVDLPALYPEFLRPGVRVLDGETVTIGDARVGFVGGGLSTPMRTPYEISDDDYAAKLAALGAVDVLCTHIPPDIPELLYDTAAGRHERGSAATLALIEAQQPRWALFGHVHQPQTQQLTVGRTRCVNVGHFRASRTPYVLDL